MSRLLNIIRIVLLVILCLLNIYCFFFDVPIVSWGHVLYLFLLIIIVSVTIKDYIKSNVLNKSIVYNIIFILIFLIMGVILIRTLFDNNLFFNKYLGDNFSTFIEFRMLYLKQNMIYFNMMFILVCIYRKINLKRY